MEGAHEWVGGRGHAAQIRPTLVPIYGLHGPMEGKNRGTENGGRRQLRERKKEEGVVGVTVGQGKVGVGLGFFLKAPVRCMHFRWRIKGY